MATAQLPAHKVIPQTGFIVDGFKYRSPLIKAYFLSHAHGDHYTGLRDTWDYGPIYCSDVTGKLIVQILGVQQELIKPIPWDSPTLIEGVEITLIDANHCPGAAQILFKLQNGETYIHCGDMRFGPHLLENSFLQRFQGCNAVFLDTTYCNPKYTFPPQGEAVEYIATTIEKLLATGDGKRRLILIQTYVIGKEHILIEVFRRCRTRLFLSERKLGIMKCLDMPGLDPDVMFTTNPDETNIHLTQWGWLGESWPFFRPNFKNMEQARREMRVDEVVGFCPTGWMYEMKKKTYPVRSKGACKIHLVPYSEHSSYKELREYVAFLKPHKVVPTVGVDGEDADKNRRAMLKHFRNLVNETASKASFLAAFTRTNSSKEGDESPSNEEEEVDEEVLEGAVAEEVEAEEAEGGEADGGYLVNARDSVAALQILPDVDGPISTRAPSQQPEMLQSAEETPDLRIPQLHLGEGEPRHKQSDHNDIPPEIVESLDRSDHAAVAAEREAEGHVHGESQSFEMSLASWADRGPANSSGGAADMADARLAAKGAPSPDDTGRCHWGTEQPPSTEEAESGSRAKELVAVLGGVVSTATAAQLLQKCGGDPERAVNAYYDGLGSALTSGSPPTKSKTPMKPTPKAKAPKRKGGSRSVAGPAKQAKLSLDQRQITSFFSGQAGKASMSLPASRPAIAPDPSTIQTSNQEGWAVDTDIIIVSSEADAQDSKEDASPLARDDRHVVEAREALTKPKLRFPPVPRPARTLKKSPQPEAKEVKLKEEQIVDLSVKVAQPGKPIKAAEQQAVDRTSEVQWDAVLRNVKDYNPVDQAIWVPGQPAPYLHIARALSAMDSTTKRLRISDVIANMFRSLLALSPDDILPAAYLVTGKLAPDYEGVEMNVGGSIISSAVIDATGATKQRLGAMYKELGDLGDVAQACRHNQATLQKPAPLTVRGVFKTMKQIASEKGNGSALRKQRAVLSLLRSAREEEPKYLVRTLISNLRVGANWRSVIPGLARAFVLHEKGPGIGKAELDAASAKVSEAFHLCPNLDVLVPALREGGLAELERRCTLKAGVPLKPMLAKICEGIPDALRQLRGDFLAEFKYDGQRSQIHLLSDGSVRLFSRNCEDKTAAFPDVVEIIQQASHGGAHEMVIDAELVAVDRSDNDRLRAFQELSTRARGQTELHQVSVQVCVFVFDILMVDGEALIKRSLRERRSRIPEALPCMRPGYIQLAQSLQLSQQLDDTVAPTPTPALSPAIAHDTAASDAVNADAEDSEASTLEAQVQTYLLESFASGTEGLMLKALDTNATYQASKRSESWLKLKRDYCEGLRDSLDLVPIGAWYGQGRKTGWFSPFLLAAWDPEKEEFQSVCRCMSGFTDAFYTEATARLKLKMCERKAYYNTGEHPSVWFEPTEVWEIRGADLTVSPVHRAAIGCISANLERGVSLRFPRYIRTREDKTVEEASNPEVIVDLFNKQTRKMSSAKELLEAQKKQDTAAPNDGPRQGESDHGCGSEEDEDEDKPCE